MDQLGPDRKEPDQGPDIEPPSGAPPTAADTHPAQPATPAEPGAAADATQAFKRECDLRSQKRITGSARAVSKRAVAMDFPYEPQCLGEA